MGLVALALAGLYYAFVLPPSYLLQTLVISPVYFVGYHVLLPPAFFLQYVFGTVSFVFDVAKSYDDLAIYFSIAVMFGIIAGGYVHVTTQLLLGVGSQVVARHTPLEDPAPRTVSTFREQRKRKRDARLSNLGDLNAHVGPPSPWTDGDGDGILSQTILEEEEDSDF